MIIAIASVRLLVISPHAYNGSTGTAIPVNAMRYVDKERYTLIPILKSKCRFCVIRVVVFIRVQNQRGCRDPK